MNEIWSCKIGEADPAPPAHRLADGPMRDAVTEAYRRITGLAPKFLFSGWGAELDEPERAVVEDRLPVPPSPPEPAEGLLNEAFIEVLRVELSHSKFTKDRDRIDALCDMALAHLASQSPRPGYRLVGWLHENSDRDYVCEEVMKAWREYKMERAAEYTQPVFIQISAAGPK